MTFVPIWMKNNIRIIVLGLNNKFRGNIILLSENHPFVLKDSPKVCEQRPNKRWMDNFAASAEMKVKAYKYELKLLRFAPLGKLLNVIVHSRSLYLMDIPMSTSPRCCDIQF